MPASPRCGALARLFLLILGCLAVAWGLFALPVFWREASLEYAARRIIRGEAYDLEVLKRQIPVIEMAENAAVCRSAALWSAAVVRLRLVEQSLRDAAGKPADLGSLVNSIRHSLSCSPAEPFLWLVLYWAQNVQNGFRPEYLQYLRMSYRLGPYEGWIALKRNPVAFADFERLPADLAQAAVNEFAAILRNGFHREAAEIFSGPAWQVRDVVLPYLGTLSHRERDAFARIVNDRGRDFAMPDVQPTDAKR
jgi:hypothetical protein